MQKYLPSKQFVRIILLAILGGLIIFFVGKILNKKTVWNNSSSESVVASSQNQDYFSQDTDGDGLYDWEEVLWGTNSALKDTDGDGIDDKKYVENKRKTSDFDESYKADPSNETEAFAKQFFITTAVLNKSGTFNQETVNDFSAGVDQSIVNFNLKDSYTLSDLKLSPVSPETYYNSFKNLYNSLPYKNISELETLSQIIQNPEDVSALEKIANINLMYIKLRDGMIKMEVPYAASGTHLFFVNNLDKISKILLEAKNINNDPLKVTTYLSKYNEYSNNIQSSLKSFSIYFSQNGIIQ